MDTLENLNAYLEGGIDTVKGWCAPQLWQALWPLACEIGQGPVAEIGVFEGKFLIGLTKTFGGDATAFDVFDMQEFNLDGAGVGKIEKVKQNFAAHGLSADQLQCITADSLALGSKDAETFLTRSGPAHFFSVDGCHEVVHTVNDIRFAMSVTAHQSIIAVDDYTNANWPGVQEAVARMYLMDSPRFVPLAVIANKLLLCSYSFHQKYLAVTEAYVAQHFQNTRIKRVVRFGYETLTLSSDLNRRTLPA